MGVAEVGILELADVEAYAHGIVALQVKHVLNGAALGIACALGYVVHLEPIAASLLGEEEKRVVHGGGIYILGKVLLA